MFTFQGTNAFLYFTWTCRYFYTCVNCKITDRINKQEKVYVRNFEKDIYYVKAPCYWNSKLSSVSVECLPQRSMYSYTNELTECSEI